MVIAEVSGNPRSGQNARYCRCVAGCRLDPLSRIGSIRQTRSRNDHPINLLRSEIWLLGCMTAVVEKHRGCSRPVSALALRYRPRLGYMTSIGRSMCSGLLLGELGSIARIGDRVAPARSCRVVADRCLFGLLPHDAGRLDHAGIFLTVAGTVRRKYSCTLVSSRHLPLDRSGLSAPAFPLRLGPPLPSPSPMRVAHPKTVNRDINHYAKKRAILKIIPMCDIWMPELVRFACRLDCLQ
jgi:hypothetical protein